MSRRKGGFTFWKSSVMPGLAVCAAAVLLSGAALYAQEGGNQAAAAWQEGVAGWFPEWAKYDVLGVEVWQFITAFVLLLAGLVVKKVSDHVFERRLVPLLEKTRFSFDGLLARAAGKPLGFLFLLAGVTGALSVLTLPDEPNVRGFVFGALKVLFAADVLWFLFRLVDVLVEYLAGLARRTESKLDDQIIPLIRRALKVTIGVVCSIWVVQVLGYNVGSLLAGLGIGGLAVALALQDSLANFFGSVFIFLDRPFAVGDVIKVGETEGTVEEIGFRSTRIRTFGATLVSIPNKTVANTTIDNWSKRPKRRVKHRVGVTYDTGADRMEHAVAAIREILEKDDGVDPDNIVVRFDEFGDSSLNIVLMYFTKATDYAGHMETKERINLAVMRAIEDLGLSIAFPTRTIHIEGDAAKRMTAAPPEKTKG